MLVTYGGAGDNWEGEDREGTHAETGLTPPLSYSHRTLPNSCLWGVIGEGLARAHYYSYF